MPRENLNDLQAFAAVAREHSFTRAAAQLGVSQSALSHTIRGLETRVGMRLLTRTTRSVACTEAGERLLRSVAPRLEEIDEAIRALGELRDKPAGTVRISATDHAIRTILWPRLRPLLHTYPDIKVEIDADYGMTDIVARGFDLGVRHGDEVAKDMIAVRIAPDLRMAIVGAPSYLARQPMPASPHDLMLHNCINLRLPTHGGTYAWELSKGGREVRVRVEGQLTFNTTYQMLEAALDGFGLAYLPADIAEAHVHAGRLHWVLEDWFPSFPGLHVYYPTRRHEGSRAVALVVDALRYRP